jgi:phage/plasmid-associated DNA primase
MDKQDGVVYYTKNFGDPTHSNTLLIGTPSGGYHLVYKYEDGIKSGQLEKDVLVDILSDRKGMCFGPGYEILNKTLPSSLPKKLVQQIVINNINCGQVTNLIVPRGKDIRGQSARGLCQLNIKNHEDYSDEINNIMGSNVVWDVVATPDGKCRTLIPQTNACTVNPEHVHTDTKHSRLVVSRSRVIARCFSHGEISITGATSKRLRSMFFSDDISNTFEDMMQELMELANRENLGRMNGSVWRANEQQPWKYTKTAESYETFVNSVLAGNRVFMRNPKKFADVIRYLEVMENPAFPFLKKNMDYIGFKNCVLNIVTFEVSDSARVVPRHYIDSDFSWDAIDTPIFDGLLKCQLGDGEEYGYMLALIGRLFFATTRFDNYDVVPLVKGDSGTGKSTLLTVIEHMFAQGTIGVINSNNELTFGLETKYNKELLLAHEVGERFTERLASDLFKQMVCGEVVNIPRKNRSAIDIKWTTPIFICSNVHLSYKDIQGSISRRLMIFRFEQYIENKDTCMKDKIIRLELPAIIGKCLNAYKIMLETIGQDSIWKHCPEYFTDSIDQMKEETDYIYMFLTLPPGDNVYNGNSVYFMKNESSVMLLQDFKRMFNNYMRYRHPSVKYKWTSDYSSIKRLGYKIEHMSLCKGCGQEAISGCCKYYNAANRSKRYVIKYLQCVQTPVTED